MKALLIVDMQNDFMPGGALPVPKGDSLIPIINSLIPKFDCVIASLDWHPSHHISFASSHPGKKVGDVIEVDGVKQNLWPVHCVAGTFGSELVAGLNTESIAAYFHKGTDEKIDSYSAFFDNAHRKATGLSDELNKREITEIYLVGVVTEYCVLYSALDAIELRFSVHVISDACRALRPQDERRALAAIAAKGGKIDSYKKIF